VKTRKEENGNSKKKKKKVFFTALSQICVKTFFLEYEGDDIFSLIKNKKGN